MAKVLAVDDNLEILEIIKEALELDGHLVYTAENVKEALVQLQQLPDILLLDIMLPGKDGLTFCREIRNKVDIPIIFITAKSNPADVVEGLAFGGDEYIKKPFSIAELRARVNAHLRRETRGKHNRFVLGKFDFNLSDFTLRYQDIPIELTKTEYDLAEYLALHHGQVFSKQQLYDTVWGLEEDGNNHTVVEHIRKLRDKLQNFAGMDPIATVWGVGYSWKKTKRLTGMFIERIVSIPIFVIAITILVVSVDIIFLKNEIILPANFSEKYLKDQERILAEDFKTENIAFFYDFVLYDERENIIETNMNNEELRKIERGEKSYYGLFGSVVQRHVLKNTDETLVLSYMLKPHYNNATWDRILPSWDIVSIFVWLLLLIIYCIFIAKSFTNQIKENLEPMIEVTKKIGQQDLNFKIQEGNIVEVNQVGKALEQMKNELEKSLELQWLQEAEKNNQIAAIAHDIKTPLTIITSRAELLQERAGLKEAKGSLQSIENAGRQIENLMEQLIETSLNKPLEIKKEEQILMPFFDAIRSNGKLLASRKGQEFKSEVTLKDGKATFDADLLERAIMNIIDNAVYYAPEKATISLHVRENERTLEIEVCNTGSHFSKEVIINGTKLFYREECERKTENHYGLGLYNAERIVKAHNGNIKLNNGEEGATVFVVLPLQ